MISFFETEEMKNANRQNKKQNQQSNKNHHNDGVSDHDEGQYTKDQKGHYDREEYGNTFSDDNEHYGAGSGGGQWDRYYREYDPTRYDRYEKTKHKLNENDDMGNGRNNSPDFDIRRDFEQGKGYASFGGSEGADDNYGSQDENSDRTGNTWISSEKNYTDQHQDKDGNGYAGSDEKIKEEVRDRLYKDESIDAISIDVLVREGKVILSGTTTSKDASRTAEQIAASVSGVVDVENRLQIKTVLGNEPTPPSGNENIGNKSSIGSNVVPSPGGGTPR
jgi:hypothetical protein